LRARTVGGVAVLLGNQPVYGIAATFYDTGSDQLRSRGHVMPLQNRVTPEGDIIASAARGTMFGNRGGRIHGPDQRLGTKRWHSKQWICCVLAFKGRRRPLMVPNRYTELFFLDEATALSAGHRPCFECRREAAMQFATLWNGTRGLPGRAAAGDMDDQLHRDRVSAQGTRPVWTARCRDLPDAAFVRWPQAPAGSPMVGLLRAGRFYSWSFDGYGAALLIAPDTLLEVLTPKSIVAILGAGYRPVLHASALGADMV
jgi:hypothetical protein